MNVFVCLSLIFKKCQQVQYVTHTLKRTRANGALVFHSALDRYSHRMNMAGHWRSSRCSCRSFHALISVCWQNRGNKIQTNCCRRHLLKKGMWSVSQSQRSGRWCFSTGSITEMKYIGTVRRYWGKLHLQYHHHHHYRRQPGHLVSNPTPF